MDKIKEAISELFEGKVDDGSLDKIVEMIEVKIAEKAKVKLDESLEKAKKEQEDSLNESNEKDLKEYKETLAKTISKYLDIGLNEFVEENKPEIESEIIVEMSKTFTNGLMTLMKESNVKIAESDVDVVADLEKKNKELQTRLDEQIQENADNIGQNLEYEKSIAFMEMTNKYTETQKEKALDLMTEVECSDIDSFKRKLEIVLEQFTEDKKIVEKDFKEYDIKDGDKLEESKKEKNTKKTKADMILEESK